MRGIAILNAWKLVNQSSLAKCGCSILWHGFSSLIASLLACMEHHEAEIRKLLEFTN
jgi:hypothetical protein